MTGFFHMRVSMPVTSPDFDTRHKGLTAYGQMAYGMQKIALL